MGVGAGKGDGDKGRGKGRERRVVVRKRELGESLDLWLGEEGRREGRRRR